MKIIKITRKIFIYIRSYYFNIMYLPIYQAIKLPIILENVKISKNKGGVKLLYKVTTFTRV